MLPSSKKNFTDSSTSRSLNSLSTSRSLGRQVGEFEKLSRIGESPNGVVYRPPDAKPYGQSNSYFYGGKTTFGGANLRKNIRRLRTTPYALSNVRSIEAKPSAISRHSTSFSALNQDCHLSSVTQRVLESLEKAATPIRDAKRRFQPVLNDRSSLGSTKLFDTCPPSAKNNGHCNVDFTYKPLKYVLAPAFEQLKRKRQSNTWSCPTCCVDNEESEDKCVSCEEPNPSKKAKAVPSIGNFFTVDSSKPPLQQSQPSLPSFGSSTFLSAEPKLGLPSFSAVSAATTTSAEEESTTSTTKFVFSAPSTIASTDSAISSGPKFSFSSPVTIPKIDVSPPLQINSKLDINFTQAASSSTATSATNGPSLFSSGSKSTSGTNSIDSVFGGNASVEKTDKGFNFQPTQTVNNSNAPTLFENTWSCPTCCVNNDVSDDKCVCCEEPNPSKKAKAVPSIGNFFTVDSSKPPLLQSQPSLPSFGSCTSPAKPKLGLPSFPAVSAATTTSAEEESTTSTTKFAFSAPSTIASTDSAISSGPKFSFSSPVTIPKIDVSPPLQINSKLDINFTQAASSSTATSATNGPSLFSFGSKSTSGTNSIDSVFGGNASVEATDKGFNFQPTQTVNNSNAPTLFENTWLKKKRESNTWSCPTCCVDNEVSDDKCVSCEEPNPGQKAKAVPSIGNLFAVDSSKPPLQQSQPSLPSFGSSTFLSTEPKLGLSSFSAVPATTTSSVTTSTSLSSAFSAPSTITTASTSSSISSGPKFSFGSPVTIPKIDVSPPLQNNSKLNINFTQAASSTATSATNGPSLFSFGSKSTSGTNSIDSVFGGNASVKTTDNEVSDDKCVSCEEPNPGQKAKAVPSIGNLFAVDSSLPPLQQSQPSLPSFGSSTFLSTEPKLGLSSFSAVPATTTSSVTTSTSLFSAFSAPSTITTASTSSSISSGPKFSFGSPVTIPKIDVGPPLQINSKLNINFTQAASSTATSATNGPSLFSFGSKSTSGTNSIDSVFGGNASVEATDKGFNFQPTQTVNNSNAPTLFGSSGTSSFSFGANAAAAPNTTNASSMFTFGAKPAESSQQQPAAQSTPFAFQAPFAVSNNTGFNFGQAANPTAAQQPAVPSFGSMFGANACQQPSQPVIPAFGSTSFPTATPQTNAGFKFNADPNLNFASFSSPAAVVPGDANAGNMFAFTADQQSSMPNNRQIKKAKRRLR